MMSEAEFRRCLAVAWLPENDGQEYHVTQGDRGGATRFGVTFALFSAWRMAHQKKEPTHEDFETCDKEELVDIIRAWIWQPCECDQLPIGIDLMVFEACFMSGPREAVHCLQACLGVRQDGIIGPETLAAVEKSCATSNGTVNLVHEIADYYDQWLGEIHGGAVFLKGWKRRVTDDVGTAIQWIYQEGAERATS